MRTFRGYGGAGAIAIVIVACGVSGSADDGARIGSPGSTAPCGDGGCLAADGDGGDEAAAGPIPAWVPPAAANGELVFEASAAVATPASWNPNLPKLASDGANLYAVHAFNPAVIGDRRAVVLHRRAGGGAWTLDTLPGAEFRGFHQPPGLVVDDGPGKFGNLHIVFNCLGAAFGNASSCYPGGAVAGTNAYRFYHLVFGAAASGARDLTAYANANEFTGENHGYMGLAVLGNRIEWTFLSAATSGTRIYQTEADANLADFVTLAPAIAAANASYLYPLLLKPPPILGFDRITFVGEHRDGQGNASYEAAVLLGSKGGGPFETLARVTSPNPPRADAPTGAFPSDLVDGGDGSVYAVAYVRPALGDGGPCASDTSLVRLSGTAEDRSIETTPIPRCVGSYAKLQLAPSGRLFLVFAGEGGNKLGIGVSSDKGKTWTWHDIPLVLNGAPPEDVSFVQYTLVTPTSSPKGFDPAKIVFFMTGSMAPTTCSASTHYPTTTCAAPADCFTCRPSKRSYVGSVAIE